MLKPSVNQPMYRTNTQRFPAPPPAAAARGLDMPRRMGDGRAAWLLRAEGLGTAGKRGGMIQSERTGKTDMWPTQRWFDDHHQSIAHDR